MGPLMVIVWASLMDEESGFEQKYDSSKSVEICRSKIKTEL